MPASRATAFDRLAPDQRAAVELVLRQGRSYGELSDLLGMPEETIRTRARSGLAALAPDLPAPARSGEIADWLLGQQSQAHAERTRALLLAEPDAHRWAAQVAAPLREIPGGEAVPALPTGPDQPRVNGKTAPARPRPTTPRRPPARQARTRGGAERRHAPRRGRRGRRAHARRRLVRRRPARTPPPIATPPLRARVFLPPRRRAAHRRRARDRGIVLAFVFTRGTDEPETSAGTPPTATATPSTTAVAANQVLLRGPAGSTAVGLMELFRANDDTVRFAIAAQGIAANAEGQRYSIWLTREDGRRACSATSATPSRRTASSPPPARATTTPTSSSTGCRPTTRSRHARRRRRQGTRQGHPQRRPPDGG